MMIERKEKYLVIYPSSMGKNQYPFKENERKEIRMRGTQISEVHLAS